MRGLICLGLICAAASFSRSAEMDAPRLEHRLFISPAEIRRWDTRILAELLVERLHRECDMAGKFDFEEKPVRDDASIVIMIPSSVIPSIAKYGFLNQHQTLTSQGFHLVPTRFAAEQELAMARMPYSHKGRELLPKYALLIVDRPDFGAFPLPTRYGGVAVVFKKEVMKRATWTYADSLDFHFQAGRFKSGGAANPVLTHTFGYRRKPEDKNRCGNYCEAQIWGALSLEDVDYAMIRDTESLTSSLLESGLRIYRYSSPAGSLGRFVRGELLAEGTPAKIRTPIARGREALDTGSEAVPSPAVKNHLTSIQRALMKDDELVESAASAGNGPSVVSKRRLLVGELAMRPKYAMVVRELKQAFVSNDQMIRVLALYGLSELPWKEFRPYLIEGLKDKDSEMNAAATAFASEHQNDLEVARLVRDLSSRPGRDLLKTGEWIDRLSKAHFCE